MEGHLFDAINVTIPYKQKVIPYLEEISDEAQAIGAVNTIVNRNGQLFGYNTDFGGMKALLHRLRIDPSRKKALVLGTGGTSLTASALLKSLGAREIYRVSRTGRDGALTYEQAVEMHPDASVIINTTPCGMYPKGEDCPLDLSAFSHLEGVVDAVYNPLRTNLVLQAQESGIPAEGGLYMLVAQAVLAAEIFLGKAPGTFGVSEMERVYREMIAKKENIVLAGMPSCGKTTVSALLAQKLGMACIDTDEEIVRKAGISIPEIFARFGESYFRDLESEVISELAKDGGRIIATGGGAVLRQENVRRLKQNGRIFFIDRPLEELITTDSRPLSNSREKLMVMYERRYPVYCGAADVRVPVQGDAAAFADAIINARRSC